MSLKERQKSSAKLLELIKNNKLIPLNFLKESVEYSVSGIDSKTLPPFNYDLLTRITQETEDYFNDTADTYYEPVNDNDKCFVQSVMVFSDSTKKTFKQFTGKKNIYTTTDYIALQLFIDNTLYIQIHFKDRPFSIEYDYNEDCFCAYGIDMEEYKFQNFDDVKDTGVDFYEVRVWICNYIRYINPETKCYPGEIALEYCKEYNLLESIDYSLTGIPKKKMAEENFIEDYRLFAYTEWLIAILGYDVRFYKLQKDFKDTYYREAVVRPDDNQEYYIIKDDNGEDIKIESIFVKVFTDKNVSISVSYMLGRQGSSINYNSTLDDWFFNTFKCHKMNGFKKIYISENFDRFLLSLSSELNPDTKYTLDTFKAEGYYDPRVDESINYSVDNQSIVKKETPFNYNRVEEVIDIISDYVNSEPTDVVFEDENIMIPEVRVEFVLKEPIVFPAINESDQIFAETQVERIAYRMQLSGDEIFVVNPSLSRTRYLNSIQVIGYNSGTDKALISYVDSKIVPLTDLSMTYPKLHPGFALWYWLLLKNLFKDTKVKLGNKQVHINESIDYSVSTISQKVDTDEIAFQKVTTITDAIEQIVDVRNVEMKYDALLNNSKPGKSSIIRLESPIGFKSNVLFKESYAHQIRVYILDDLSYQQVRILIMDNNMDNNFLIYDIKDDVWTCERYSRSMSFNLDNSFDDESEAKFMLRLTKEINPSTKYELRDFKRGRRRERTNESINYSIGNLGRRLNIKESIDNIIDGLSKILPVYNNVTKELNLKRESDKSFKLTVDVDNWEKAFYMFHNKQIYIHYLFFTYNNFGDPYCRISVINDESSLQEIVYNFEEDAWFYLPGSKRFKIDSQYAQSPEFLDILSQITEIVAPESRYREVSEFDNVVEESIDYSVNDIAMKKTDISEKIDDMKSLIKDMFGSSVTFDNSLYEMTAQFDRNNAPEYTIFGETAYLGYIRYNNSIPKDNGYLQEIVLNFWSQEHTYNLFFNTQFKSWTFNIDFSEINELKPGDIKDINLIELMCEFVSYIDSDSEWCNPETYMKIEESIDYSVSNIPMKKTDISEKIDDMKSVFRDIFGTNVYIEQDDDLTFDVLLKDYPEYTFLDEQIYLTKIGYQYSLDSKETFGVWLTLSFYDSHGNMVFLYNTVDSYWANSRIGKLQPGQIKDDNLIDLLSEIISYIDPESKWCNPETYMKVEESIDYSINNIPMKKINIEEKVDAMKSVFRDIFGSNIYIEQEEDSTFDVLFKEYPEYTFLNEQIYLTRICYEYSLSSKKTFEVWLTLSFYDTHSNMVFSYNTVDSYWTNSRIGILQPGHIKDSSLVDLLSEITSYIDPESKWSNPETYVKIEESIDYSINNLPVKKIEVSDKIDDMKTLIKDIFGSSVSFRDISSDYFVAEIDEDYTPEYTLWNKVYRLFNIQYDMTYYNRTDSYEQGIILKLQDDGIVSSLHFNTQYGHWKITRYTRAATLKPGEIKDESLINLLCEFVSCINPYSEWCSPETYMKVDESIDYSINDLPMKKTDISEKIESMKTIIKDMFRSDVSFDDIDSGRFIAKIAEDDVSEYNLWDKTFSLKAIDYLLTTDYLQRIILRFQREDVTAYLTFITKYGYWKTGGYRKVHKTLEPGEIKDINLIELMCELISCIDPYSEWCNPETYMKVDESVNYSVSNINAGKVDIKETLDILESELKYVLNGKYKVTKSDDTLNFVIDDFINDKEFKFKKFDRCHIFSIKVIYNSEGFDVSIDLENHDLARSYYIDIDSNRPEWYLFKSKKSLKGKCGLDYPEYLADVMMAISNVLTPESPCCEWYWYFSDTYKMEESIDYSIDNLPMKKYNTSEKLDDMATIIRDMFSYIPDLYVYIHKENNYVYASFKEEEMPEYTIFDQKVGLDYINYKVYDNTDYQEISLKFKNSTHEYKLTYKNIEYSHFWKIYVSDNISFKLRRNSIPDDNLIDLLCEFVSYVDPGSPYSEVNAYTTKIEESIDYSVNNATTGKAEKYPFVECVDEIYTNLFPEYEYEKAGTYTYRLILPSELENLVPRYDFLNLRDGVIIIKVQFTDIDSGEILIKVKDKDGYTYIIDYSRIKQEWDRSSVGDGMPISLHKSLRDEDLAELLATISRYAGFNPKVCNKEWYIDDTPDIQDVIISKRKKKSRKKVKESVDYSINGLSSKGDTRSYSEKIDDVSQELFPEYERKDFDTFVAFTLPKDDIATAEKYKWKSDSDDLFHIKTICFMFVDEAKNILERIIVKFADEFDIEESVHYNNIHGGIWDNFKEYRNPSIEHKLTDRNLADYFAIFSRCMGFKPDMWNPDYFLKSDMTESIDYSISNISSKSNLLDYLGDIAIYYEEALFPDLRVDYPDYEYKGMYDEQYNLISDNEYDSGYEYTFLRNQKIGLMSIAIVHRTKSPLNEVELRVRVYKKETKSKLDFEIFYSYPQDYWYCYFIKSDDHSLEGQLTDVSLAKVLSEMIAFFRPDSQCADIKWYLKKKVLKNIGESIDYSISNIKPQSVDKNKLFHEIVAGFVAELPGECEIDEREDYAYFYPKWNDRFFRYQRDEFTFSSIALKMAEGLMIDISLAKVDSLSHTYFVYSLDKPYWRNGATSVNLKHTFTDSDLVDTLIDFLHSIPLFENSDCLDPEWYYPEREEDITESVDYSLIDKTDDAEHNIPETMREKYAMYTKLIRKNAEDIKDWVFPQAKINLNDPNRIIITPDSSEKYTIFNKEYTIPTIKLINFYDRLGSYYCEVYFDDGRPVGTVPCMVIGLESQIWREENILNGSVKGKLTDVNLIEILIEIAKIVFPDSPCVEYDWYLDSESEEIDESINYSVSNLDNKPIDFKREAKEAAQELKKSIFDGYYVVPLSNAYALVIENTKYAKRYSYAGATDVIIEDVYFYFEDIENIPMLKAAVRMITDEWPESKVMKISNRCDLWRWTHKASQTLEGTFTDPELVDVLIEIASYVVENSEALTPEWYFPKKIEESVNYSVTDVTKKEKEEWTLEDISADRRRIADENLERFRELFGDFKVEISENDAWSYIIKGYDLGDAVDMPFVLGGKNLIIDNIESKAWLSDNYKPITVEFTWHSEDHNYIVSVTYDPIDDEICNIESEPGKLGKLLYMVPEMKDYLMELIYTVNPDTGLTQDRIVLYRNY